jgi:deoxyribose-phosphate aldolase
MDRARLEPLIRTVVEELATPGGLAAPAAAVPPAGELASLIDQTLLTPDATASAIDRLCQQALEYGFAAVCVNPTWVARCVRALRGSRLATCSVVAFPLGAALPEVKRFEAQQAIADGVREIDMVVNLGALKSGDLPLVVRDIEALTGVCRASGVVSKIIIEAAVLTTEEKIVACALAQHAGADYVKTSTGFGPGGATVADVALMRRVVGDRMGVKAAGGVRDLASARALIAAGATRIGTSAGPRIVDQSRTIVD